MTIYKNNVVSGSKKKKVYIPKRRLNIHDIKHKYVF